MVIKKKLSPSFFKALILVSIALLAVFPISRYFDLRLYFDPNNYVEINLNKILAILILNLVFFSLLFMIKISYYVRVFELLLIVFVLLSIIVLIQNMKLPRDLWTIWDFYVLIVTSMLSPGLIIMIIYYIRNKTSKYDNAKLFGKYHIHEGFVGIILLILAISLILIRINTASIIVSGFNILSAILQIFIFIFLYLSSLLIFRDWKDVTKLKFIEREDNISVNRDSREDIVFNHIGKEDLPFFSMKRFIYYPLGMILTFFSINLITFVSGYIPTKFFLAFEYDTDLILVIGYICCIFGGCLIGLDWFRLFKRFYPELYRDLEVVLNKLKEK